MILENPWGSGTIKTIHCYCYIQSPLFGALWMPLGSLDRQGWGACVTISQSEGSYKRGQSEGAVMFQINAPGHHL